MSQNQVTTQKHRKFKFEKLLVALTAITVILSTAAHAQVVKGNGTPGTVPVWTSNATIGNSIVSQAGANINVNGGVNATGTVTAPNFSGSFFGNGSGLGNVNASLLGGLGPGGFAQLGNPNTFSADQTIDGNLDLTGYLNHSLLLQASVTNSSAGDMSANVIGGFGGNNAVPANSVAGGVAGATIAGGGGTWSGSNAPNSVTQDFGTVGGGADNTAGGRFAVVGGGAKNTANGYQGSVVGGGQNNTSGGISSTVCGGNGNVASGDESTVPGGRLNIAAGFASFAAGEAAQAKSDYSFVWNDGTGTLNDFGPKTFSVRASNGFVFYTGPSSGAYLPAGSGSWASLSDRSVKANLMAVNGHAILERLASLPIATWNYTSQSDSVRHMGPMAQDFREAFGLGEDEKHISAVDSEGVALAAIQALYQEKQQEVSQLQDRLAALERRLATLESSK